VVRRLTKKRLRRTCFGISVLLDRPRPGIQIWTGVIKLLGLTRYLTHLGFFDNNFINNKSSVAPREYMYALRNKTRDQRLDHL
jgi:hypothetical protein